MKLSIREASLRDSSDGAAIVHVLDTYAADPVGAGQPLPAEVRAQLLPALREHGNARVFLASDGAVPVGLAICFVGLSTFQARPLLNVHDLAVVPTHRGRGIGRALLTAAEDWALRHGCCKLTLEVQDANTRARTLYERFGFTDYVLGEPVTTRFLCKELPAADQADRDALSTSGRPA